MSRIRQFYRDTISESFLVLLFVCGAVSIFSIIALAGIEICKLVCW